MVLLENIQVAISGLTLVGIIIAVYKSFSDPDNKAKNRLDVLENNNAIKHAFYDKAFVTFSQEISLIKDNHLRHIESDVSDLKGDVKSILAILNDRQTR